MIPYITKVWVGTETKKALFPIEEWNVRERVINDKGRTRNKQEVWHGCITSDQYRKLNMNGAIDLILGEQSQMQNNYAQLYAGVILHKKSPLEKQRDELLKNLTQNLNAILKQQKK